jgi:hypothetical protein
VLAKPGDRSALPPPTISSVGPTFACWLSNIFAALTHQTSQTATGRP